MSGNEQEKTGMTTMRNGGSESDTWSVVVWTASLNEQTRWTASAAGRYSDASSTHWKRDTSHY